MVPFWIPIIVRPLIFRVPKKGTIILTTTHIGGSNPIYGNCQITGEPKGAVAHVASHEGLGV